MSSRVRLREIGRDSALVFFEATLPACETAVSLRYVTRTGAIARVDGATVGVWQTVAQPEQVHEQINQAIHRAQCSG